MRIYKILIIVLALFSLHAEAADRGDLLRCANWLSTQVEKNNQPYIWPAGPLEKKEVAPASKYSSVNTDVFTVARVVGGLHGGERLVLKRSIAWHDGRRNVNDMASVTQDLRLFPSIVGLLEARFFGFQQISPTKMIVPTPDELNAAIDDFNKELSKDDPRFIKIKFYESTSAAEVAEDYVRRFALNGEIPISLLGRQFTHDISAHALEGLFANNEFISILQERANIWLDFSEQMRKNGQGRIKNFELWNTNVIDSLARQIDQLGMAPGDYVDRDTRLFMDQVGIAMAKESQATGNSIALMPEIGEHSHIIQGMAPGNVPALTFQAKTFFTLKYLTENISTKYLFMFNTFVDSEIRARPERFRMLSFDLEEQTKELKTIRKKEKMSTKEREAAFASLPMSAPYIARLKHLRNILLNTVGGQ